MDPIDLLQVALGSTALAAAVVALQGADVVSLAIDRRQLSDHDEVHRATREKARELFWAVVAAGLGSLALAVGVQGVAALAEAREAAAAVSVAAALVVLVVGGAVAARAVASRPLQHGYPTLARALADAAARRPGRDDIDRWRDALDRIDERMSARSARAQRSGIVRLVPPVLAAANVAIAAASAALGSGTGLVLLVVGLALLAGSIALAVRGLRLARAGSDRWAAVIETQRAEVVAALADLDRRVGRRVPGLGDRVAKALAILREQQGQNGAR